MPGWAARLPPRSGKKAGAPTPRRLLLPRPCEQVTDPGCPPEEAVRIFVQFTKPDSAMKALLEMDGRFFGGRVVRVSFYDEARFEANDLLAPAAP